MLFCIWVKVNIQIKKLQNKWGLHAPYCTFCITDIFTLQNMWKSLEIIYPDVVIYITKKIFYEGSANHHWFWVFLHISNLIMLVPLLSTRGQWKTTLCFWWGPNRRKVMLLSIYAAISYLQTQSLGWRWLSIYANADLQYVYCFWISFLAEPTPSCSKNIYIYPVGLCFFFICM